LKIFSLTVRSCAVLLCIVASACATAPEEVHSYKLYPGPERPLEALVVVRLGNAYAAEFNGRLVTRGDWSEVHLLPGEHTIRWQTEFGVSVTIEPSGFATRGTEVIVQLEAGRVYRLSADRTKGRGYRTYLWIEDASTGAVVAGARIP
jgi:hypothetical protein